MGAPSSRVEGTGHAGRHCPGSFGNTRARLRPLTRVQGPQAWPEPPLLLPPARRGRPPSRGGKQGELGQTGGPSTAGLPPAPAPRCRSRPSSRPPTPRAPSAGRGCGLCREEASSSLAPGLADTAPASGQGPLRRTPRPEEQQGH